MIAIPATLGLVVDRISGQRCLLDSGSQISLWPASTTDLQTRTESLRLVAANSTPIKSFGAIRKQIKIGLKTYSFVFIIARMGKPILGIDFLQRFGITLDLAKRQLKHSGTSTAFSSAKNVISGVNVISKFECTAQHLLAEFPEITDVKRATKSLQHGIECHIRTTGPPISMPPRRLTPDKLRIAQQYFELMCAAGICRRSSSPWSSGLHMDRRKTSRGSLAVITEG